MEFAEQTISHVREEPIVGSIVRAVGNRKEKKRLGDVDVIAREEYTDLDLDVRVELIL